MVEIRELVDSMQATMDDMERYLTLAMDNTEYPTLSNEYYQIYLHHKSDYNDLHKVAVDFINKVAKTKQADSKVIGVMKSIWSFEHDALESKMDKIVEKEQRYKAMDV